jgi:excisionase family DNA binding protein
MAKKRPRARRLVPQSVETEILNAEGAARLLGISARHVVRLARENAIPARKIAGEWRFSRTALVRWVGKDDRPPDWYVRWVESSKKQR